MKKNKVIALLVITLGFLAAFYNAFVEIDIMNPIPTLVAVVALIVASCVAIFIGNNEKQEENSH